MILFNVYMIFFKLFFSMLEKNVIEKKGLLYFKFMIIVEWKFKGYLINVFL